MHYEPTGDCHRLREFLDIFRKQKILSAREKKYIISDIVVPMQSEVELVGFMIDYQRSQFSETIFEKTPVSTTDPASPIAV